MLSLLCAPPRIDDPFGSGPPSPFTRSLRKGRHFSLPPGTRSPFRKDSARSASKVINIGAPTSFRHEFHLGSDVSSGNVTEGWDENRWRQEIEKRIQQSPPPSAICTPNTTPTPSPSRPPRSEKRSSLVKRKPVPPLYPDEPLPAPPSPPNPVSALREPEIQEVLAKTESASAPASDVSSRDTSNRESFSTCYSAVLATPSESSSITAPAPDVVRISERVGELLADDAVTVTCDSETLKIPLVNAMDVELVSPLTGGGFKEK